MSSNLASCVRLDEESVVVCVATFTLKLQVRSCSGPPGGGGTRAGAGLINNLVTARSQLIAEELRLDIVTMDTCVGGGTAIVGMGFGIFHCMVHSVDGLTLQAAGGIRIRRIVSGPEVTSHETRKRTIGESVVRQTRAGIVYGGGDRHETGLGGLLDSIELEHGCACVECDTIARNCVEGAGCPGWVDVGQRDLKGAFEHISLPFHLCVCKQFLYFYCIDLNASSAS